MPKLPVLSTLVQAMAVFGLHIGKLFLWALIPMLLGLGSVGLSIGLAVWMDALGKGFNLWLVPVAVSILFAFQVSIPFFIRVNQLAVLGRVEKAGYMELIFSRQSFRYLGYACIVTTILAGGIALALSPYFAMSFGMKIDPSRPLLLAALGAVLVLSVSFFILTSPFQLIYPAVAVEQEPSLAAAYRLGSGNKLRLFLCLFFMVLLFLVLGKGMDWAGKLVEAENSDMGQLVLLPAQLFLSFFSSVTSTALPAVAYRILSGLPDPLKQEADRPAAGARADKAEDISEESDPSLFGQGPGESASPMKSAY